MLGVAGVLLLLLAVTYTQKDRYTGHFAELSRSIIGSENTARIEKVYFSVQDRIDRTKYSIFGGSTNPFSDGGQSPVYVAGASAAQADDLPVHEAIAPTPIVHETPAPTPTAPPRPAPLVLPTITQLSSSPEDGEGVWTPAGLPHSSPDDVLMAKTFLHPDHSRPYATVGVLVIDKRRIRVHMLGGVDDPGGDLGVHGPGTIPDSDLPNLLVAWNGGFRGPHGGFGMIADGKQYRPIRDGLASAVIMKDGSFQIGQWGRDFTINDTPYQAIRQNAVLLVDNCQVSPRTNEGNDTWGYVKVDSSEFITWRSAIGVTKNGDLLVAAGNSLSAATLAQALWAAGACYAMQLDINSPYVLTSLYFQQPDGSIKSARFMDSMPDNPNRFLNSKQPHDFMYVTLDETNYVP